MLTHQLSMSYENKLTATAFEMQIKKWTKDFDQFWVPDYEDQRLTGAMSNNSFEIPTTFIGPLSRFTEVSKEGKGILVILSGPEPQRTLLEKDLDTQLSECTEQVTFVRGSNDSKLSPLNQNFQVIPLAGSDQLQELIRQARIVITRSGYSSLMDFDVLKKPVIMIPTPGQKEQEYLAEVHRENGNMKFVEQGENLGLH